MVITLIALCVVLSLALVVMVIELAQLPRRRRRVLVNMRHDEGTVEGLLWTRAGCWLIVKDARLLRSNSDQPVPIDGEVMIDKAQVAFLQVLP